MTNVLIVEDCQEILNNCFKNDPVKYKSHTFKNLSGDVQGFLSEHGRLEIVFEEKDETHMKKFFVKVVLDNENYLTSLSKALDVFRKETFVYTKFFPALESLQYFKYIHPKCYLLKNNMLVMEDLTADGYKVGEKLKFYNNEQCKMTLNALAHYHAYGILYEEKNLKSDTCRLNVEFPKEFEDRFFGENASTPARRYIEACINSIVDLVAEIPIDTFPKKEYFQELLERNFENTSKEEKLRKKYRLTCLHGDLWASNIMFKYNEDNTKIIDCKLIDFQLLTYGIPGFDIEVFFYGNTTVSFRTEHKKKLLEYYYECFSRVLSKNDVEVSKILSFSSLMEMCTLRSPEAKLQAICDMALLYLPEEVHLEVAADPSRYETVLVSERSRYVLDVYRKNEDFRKIVNEEMGELLNLLEAKEELLNNS